MDESNMPQEDREFLADVRAHITERKYGTFTVDIAQSNIVLGLQKGAVTIHYREHFHRFPQGVRDPVVVKAYIDGMAQGMRIGRDAGTRDTQQNILSALGVSMGENGVLEFNS